MRRLLFGLLVLGAVAAIGRASGRDEAFAHYHPLTAAPERHKLLLGKVVRESRPSSDLPASPQVEWRTPDTEPMIISNVGRSEQRALRIELKSLAR